MTTTGKKALPPKLQVWIDARKRFKLSHSQIQMARELGMNPKKLGSLANHKQEPWKAPLGEFIEDVYFKRFKKERPEVVLSIEDRLKQEEKKRQEKRLARLSQDCSNKTAEPVPAGID